MTTYAYNIRFTREDENNAIEHEVGYNSYGSHISSAAEAEAQVRAAHSHLNIISMKLVAVMVDGVVIQEGTKVRFEAPLSNGGQAKWKATVLRFDGDVALVLHPRSARIIPFSPVRAAGLYRYQVSHLIHHVVKE